jgi:hypothetical protein
MMHIRYALLLALAVGLIGAGCGRPLRPVTVASQLSALTNLALFCEPPRGVSDMASTYDRRGGNVDWWDVPPPVPGTTNLYEALRVDGPGCLHRIWNTAVPATEWQFYFDGEETPRLTLTPDELFGNQPERQPLQGSISGGAYSYLPLPYARSLRIVLNMPKIEANSRPYFHLNYEQYPAGTVVQSWARQPDAVLSNALAHANASWRSVAQDQAALAPRLSWRRMALPVRQSSDVLTIGGRGTLSAFGVRPDFSRQNALMRSLLLRSLVLEAYWDGAAHPSIQVPLGDFFCNGLHPRQFASLPMANIDGTYLCRLPMPFRRGARLAIRNDGPVEVNIETAADVVSDDPGDRMYLHASFNAAMSAGAPFRIMRTTGRGKYVGCYLMALSMEGGWNILEGDEHFYRDGGNEFVHHGTGLEDYFNAGWYYFGLFERPLHGLLEKAAMRTAQYRFHLTDPVTFRKDLRMEMEFGDANSARGYMSSCAYWYQDKPGPAGSTIPPVGQRFPALDQVGYLTIMDELFELERMGLIADAEERCAFYSGALQQMPEHWIFELRRLAYREMRTGHGAIRKELAALAALTNVPPDVAQQARLLLWRGEKPGRAIFGAHAYAGYRLLVDGKPMGQGSDPFSWQAFPVELTPGEHLLQAEVTPQPQQAFFSAGFSAFFTNVSSDATWDFSRTKPDGWPASDGDPKLWQPYETSPGILPSMSWWRFVPNAFPCVQSGHQAGAPYADWANPPGLTIYLRRRIVVPASSADRPPMPIRRILDDSATPVRPKDDTSNEGIGHRNKQFGG